jgi:hypothetical protein
MTTVPYTKMLELYWHQRQHCTLTGTKAWIDEPEASSKELADRFGCSVAMFESYDNRLEPFHHTATAKGYAPKLPTWKEGETLGRGSRYAAALIAGAQVPGLPAGVTYVDRELDCLRTSRGTLFAGTKLKTKRAVVPDILLCDADGFPIVAEVKTRNDKNAIYALIQILAAAAHLVTSPQRARLDRYTKLTVPQTGPCLELWVLMHDRKTEGLSPEIHARAEELAAELSETDAIKRHIRAIRLYRTQEPARLG